MSSVASTLNQSLQTASSATPGPNEQGAISSANAAIRQAQVDDIAAANSSSASSRASEQEASYRSSHPTATIDNDNTLRTLNATANAYSIAATSTSAAAAASLTAANNSIAAVGPAFSLDAQNAAAASNIASATSAKANQATTDAAAQQTKVDAANQVLFPNTDKFLNTSGQTPTEAAKDVLTDTLSSFLKPGVQKEVTAVPPTAKIDAAHAKATTTQKSTTPAQGAVIGDNGELDNDSYRYKSKFDEQANLVPAGSFSPVNQPRTLGQSTNDKVDMAYISLTISDKATNGIKGLGIKAYSRFFLQSVSEAEQEKVQVVETFTNYYAYFFGKRPVYYRYAGLLLNDQDHKWSNDFKYYYENFFRGTKASGLSGSVSITYDGRVVTGFFVGMSMQQMAEADKGIPFSIDVLVVDHTPTYFSSDITALIAKRQLDLQNLAVDIQNFIDTSNKGSAATTLNSLKKRVQSKANGNRQDLSIHGTKKALAAGTNVSVDSPFLTQPPGTSIAADAIAAAKAQAKAAGGAVIVGGN